MSTSDVLELAGIIVGVIGGGGGLTAAVAKLTRIAVAAETAIGMVREVAGDLKEIKAVQQDHENRLNRKGL